MARMNRRACGEGAGDSDLPPEDVMAMRPAAVVLALTLAAGSVLAQPIRVVTGRGASDLERYAASELQRYLPRMTAQAVLAGDGGPAAVRLLIGTRQSNPALASFRPALAADLADQEILVRSGRLAGRPAVAVTGGSPHAVLWAAYALLEKLGAVFEFSGEILPPRKAALDLTALRLRQKPTIADRGLRLHLNFPMDQSSYSLPDFLAWVDKMARMKFSYLMFHFYSTHPWFYFRYRDAETHTGTFFVGSYLFDYRYDLPADMIGRALIHNRARYFPPELEGMDQGVELYRKTEARMRAVMDRCHARGIKVAVSFEPLSPPGDIAAHLDEWQKDFPSRDALMRDLTVERLLACMDAYPQADEYQLISVEGSSDAPANLDLKEDLRRLCRKYGVPFDPGDEASFRGAREAGVNLTPYNLPAVAGQLQQGLYVPVVSALRFIDMALEVLADPKVSERMRREGKLGNVAIYLPDGPAVKLCTPALRAMVPAGGRLQMMVDYGARGTADQMPTWDAFHGADIQLGIVTWLEFDGSMFLPEAWPHSVYDCVRNARDLPLTTLVANHWRVSGLEADAAGLAELPWRPGESYDAWMDGYLGRVFGAANAGLARKAYDALEQATLYCRAHLFNVGFCFEGRFQSGFGYPHELTDGAKALFAQAQQTFAALAEAEPEGRARLRAEYLADRCECAGYHLDAMQELGATEVPASSDAAAMQAAADHAAKALDLTRRYMTTYSRHVLDRGDEGMLVNYHFAMVRAAATRAEASRVLGAIALADPARPVMAWDFEQGDARSVPDATGNGFTATCVGPVAFAGGRHGRALKLGGDAFLRADAAAAFNPASFTIAAWVNPEPLTARRGIVSKRVGNVGAPFVFGTADGNLSFEGCGTSAAFWPFNFVGPPLQAGRWSHVAVTLEAGKEIVLYLDGRPAARKAITEGPAPNMEPVVIGREAWGGEDGHDAPAFFRGLLDDVKLWKRALTAEEIAAEASR
jgi:hypothetical protein